MNPCPRFDFCDAPLCPLDEKVDLKVREVGEPTCYYTRRSSARNRFRRNLMKKGTKLPETNFNFNLFGK